MLRRYLVLTLLCGLLAGGGLFAEEAFVGSFAEPVDGGNLDTALSNFDGSTVTIVPRAHPSEALGGATRWRNVFFAIRGMHGQAPKFTLPLMSPGSHRLILSGNSVSFENIQLVWSYEPNPTRWNKFDRYARSGGDAMSWKVEATNEAPFERDVVYVSINEHSSVSEFYEWLETDVFAHPFVAATPSEARPHTFIIGFQSGAPASGACSRAIPDTPLYGFVVRDPAAHPTKLVMLVSGQHPYEGQNKVALKAAVDWILNSRSPEANAYRADYVTLVYPFVNPTGELAGLWRGTAYQPSRDTNRNWNTRETNPARDRGIDTVIVHKNAMNKDIAALGLGEPLAVFDYHQNFGDTAAEPNYVLHGKGEAGLGSAAPFPLYFNRLTAAASMANRASGLPSEGTLRDYMTARGARMTLTFERSVYNTLASERSFGVATVQALAAVVDTSDVITTRDLAVSSPVTPSNAKPSTAETTVGQ
jgi:hypothetical protein